MHITNAQSNCTHDWINQDYHHFAQNILFLEILTNPNLIVSLCNNHLSLIIAECSSCKQHKMQMTIDNCNELTQDELACAENYEA